MISKREVVKLVLDGNKTPYAPWSLGFTQEEKTSFRRLFKTNLFISKIAKDLNLG